MINRALQRPFAGALIDKGNFYPSAARTAEVARYEAHQKGALICWNMVSYYGGPWGYLLNTTRPPAPRSLFSAQGVNVDSWIQQLKARGFDYAILTIQEEMGFLLWDSHVPRNFAPVVLPTGSGGSAFSSPQFPDGPYSVRPGTADTNILDKFLAACKKYDVSAGFYMNEIANLEVFNTQFNYSELDKNSTRYNEYIAYQCRLIQEVLLRWPVPYLWMDKATGSTAAFSQATYNAAKAINPKVVVIGNHAGEYNFSPARFPYDVGSTEEYALLGGNTSYQTTTRTFNGQSYYVGQEFVLTPYLGSQWYNYDDQNLFQFPSKPYLQLQPSADFQQLVNLGKTAARPVLVDVMVDRTGNLVQSTLDFMDQINFTRAVQLFFIGDSITQGDQQGGPGSGNTYPEVATAQLNAASNRFTLIQRGYPSMNARWFINNKLAETLALINPTTHPGGATFVIFFGPNDLIEYDVEGGPVTNHTPGGVYAAFVELATACKNAGARVVFVPILNRKDAYGLTPYTTTFDADRRAVNTSLIASSAADEVANLPARLEVYATTAPDNTTYFVDKVHPTIAGAAIIGNEVAKAVARLHYLTLSGGNGTRPS